MNRINVLAVTAVMALALTACGKPGSKPSTPSEDPAKSAVTEPAAKPAAEEPAATEKQPQAANDSEGAADQVADNSQSVDGAAAQE